MQGYKGTSIAPRALRRLAWPWQALAFFDAEHVTINKDAWTSGKNDATLRGAGLGMNWSGASQCYARV